jgi:hypothetical protein
MQRPQLRPIRNWDRDHWEQLSARRTSRRSLPKSDYLKIVYTRHCWKLRVRLKLVPERRGSDVVLQGQKTSGRPPTKSLHRNPYIALKSNGIRHMPPVKPESLV